MTVPAALTLLAAFAQVCLSLWAIVAMGRARIASLAARETTMAEIALSDRPWPEHIQKLQANARNQFETPVLFLAGTAIALGIDAANWGTATFAWLYIASRIAHRTVHVGDNIVRKRFNAFVVGLAALLGLWIALLAGALLP